MHYVPVLGLGTYYTTRGMDWAYDIPGARELRGWAFHAKDNGHSTDVVVRHPNNPDRTHYVLRSADNASWYAAQVGKILIPEAFQDLEFKQRSTILIPIPASGTTRATANGRWPALRMARALESAGVGTVLQRVYFKQPQVASHSRSQRPGADELRAALDVSNSVFIPPWYSVVYVDDLLTWGDHMVAVHEALGRPKQAMGFTVGCTDGSRVSNALEPRYRLVKYKMLDDIEVVDAPDA